MTTIIKSKVLNLALTFIYIYLYQRMRKLIFTLCCLLSTSLTFARVSPDSVISAANAKSHTPIVGTDLLVKVDIGTSTLPAFAAGVNMLWNLSSLVYDTTVHPVVTRLTPDFPYNFADSNHNDFGNLHYNDKGQTLFVLQGIISSEQSIDSQGVLVAKTGLAPDNNVDTFIFNAQNSVYSSRYTKMPFPLVYGTSWRSDYSYSESFLVTDSTRAYKKSPGKIIITKSERNHAQGWGLMKIKEPNGNTSAYAEVIQVKTINYERDSFVFGSTPMPDTLLSLFGMTQGKVTNNYSLNFYRVGRITPLLKLNYADSDLTTLVSAYVDTLNYVPDSLYPAAIAFTSLGKDITVYPNPIANHTVNIEIPQAANGNWSYDVIGISGQVLASGNLSVNGGQTRSQLVLPSAIIPGSYYLYIRNEGAPVCIKTITLVN